MIHDLSHTFIEVREEGIELLTADITHPDIVIDVPGPSTVEVALPGPQGPPGPRGASSFDEVFDNLPDLSLIFENQLQ